MNQVNRQKVLDFCSEMLTSPLYFNGYKSTKDEFNPEKYTVKQMINRVLELAVRYPSYDSNTEDFESSSGRWRSSLDIWRHIIYYYPTIEIFDVMHVLYECYHKAGGVCGQYCGDIERRTFKNTYCNDNDNYMSADYMRRIHGTKVDEYGLEWEDWKDI